VAAHRLGFDRPVTRYGKPWEDDLLARDVAGATAVQTDGSMNRYLRGRTAFFDAVVIASLDRGVSQVACLGAGYDGRSLRYARPGVRWWEVDHPDTQADKQSRVDRLGIDTAHVAFVAFDLRCDGLAAALTRHGFGPDSPTLFLCEGVIVYLEAAVVESLLRELRSCAAAGSKLALSSATSPSSEDHAARRERFRASVSALGEPVRNNLTVQDVVGLLERTGWRVDAGSGRARGAGLLSARPAVSDSPQAKCR
jgi:methyltransferase (TIGR00027 family)